MSIGMSYDDFWEGDAALPKFYREAYKLRQERETQQTNFNAWLNGLYTMKAYGVVLGNAFSDKDTEPLEYFDKPIELKSDPAAYDPPAEPTEDEVAAARLRMRIALDNFVNFYKNQEK